MNNMCIEMTCSNTVFYVYLRKLSQNLGKFSITALVMIDSVSQVCGCMKISCSNTFLWFYSRKLSRNWGKFSSNALVMSNVLHRKF